ncbi:CDP-diacylglycerol--glycerol-3-phosphate 3-phosphatidyltransferase [Streptomyces tagetis]|uniref:CDP-diacylglycerol--glycerol-3-phosphate 3-phosphatidyltransferase n=1 Tax=Streptomyces tagetis TaxID=2820809 RepID=A0A940XCZ1_9ACTN|nr:CDP-diacylglycerol--glycerol-3-phosphate 3-phosphatidyltransferase [Streptomyces sp. RG38]MBQ0824912.1 CDP-diacylglycerol--glycerol-3-phosphate 3-phosphatidyltransferase [Streptomyces sp. RG38]
MTGVPASAAGGSPGARGTGPRAVAGAAEGTAAAHTPGGGPGRGSPEHGPVERGPVERGAVERGAVERGASEGGAAGRGASRRRTAGRGATEGGVAGPGVSEDGGAGRGSTEGGAAGRGAKITAAAVNQASVWNIANFLTMLRLVLVPAFVALMLGNGGFDPAWRSFAWAAFAVAMITDLFDGHLARTYNLVTDFGKIADPIADKAIMGAALICLSALGDLPWWVTAVILGRELGITLLRFLVIRYGVIPASRGGKLKTLTQGVAVGMYVLALTGPLATLRFWVMAAAVVLTVATGLDYVRQAVLLRRRGIAERRAALRETDG